MLTRRFAVALLLSLAGAASLFAQPRVLTLGISEGKTPGSALKEHAAFIRHLNTSRDFKVDVKVFPSYDAVYAAFKAKQIDLAAIGPVKYVQARHETGAIPVAAEGSMQQSILIVRPDSPIKTVAQLKGKRFAFGYPDSTSTYLMPLLVLSKNQIKPTDLARADFVGSQQEKIIEAVLAGTHDAGAIAESVWETHKGRLRMLEKSEPFPGPPVIAQKGTPDAVIAKLRAHMMAFKPATPEERRQRFGRGVTIVSDSDYNKIRFLVKVVMKKTYVQ